MESELQNITRVLTSKIAKLDKLDTVQMEFRH